jgi:hypothetical protein
MRGLSVRMRIGMETCRFGWQYGASDRVVSQAYRRKVLSARMRIGTRSYQQVRVALAAAVQCQRQVRAASALVQRAVLYLAGVPRERGST